MSIGSLLGKTACTVGESLSIPRTRPCTHAPTHHSTAAPADCPPTGALSTSPPVLRTRRPACHKAATTDTMPSALCGGWPWTPVGISSHERCYIQSLTKLVLWIHGTNRANSH